MKICAATARINLDLKKTQMGLEEKENYINSLLLPKLCSLMQGWFILDFFSCNIKGLGVQG